jgi:hypothetical protein
MKIHFLSARLMVVCLAAMLSSCAFPGYATSSRRVHFNESDFAAYGGAGSGTVTGQLDIKSSNGGEHVGNFGGSIAGIHITLIPVTPYTEEMVEREIGDGEYLGASDWRLKKYVRLTQTDPNGYFVFHDVPAGEYFVSGLGEWIEYGRFNYQWACERVMIDAGQTIKIRLMHNLHHPGKRTLVIWALE